MLKKLLRYRNNKQDIYMKNEEHLLREKLSVQYDYIRSMTR